MTLEGLLRVNESICAAIEALPGIDPMTIVSSEEQDQGGDSAIKRIIERACEKHSDEDRDRLQKRLTQEYFEAGPLEALLSQEAITEVMINGPRSIWYEKAGRLGRHDDRFLSELTYRNFIARLGRESGIQANLDSPFADGKWRDCRVHLALPPASPTATSITLRRHPKSPWTFEHLEKSFWAPSDKIKELRRQIGKKCNLLIVGGTGSGKTSVLNACLGTLEPSERAVLIEDTSELSLPNEASLKLLTRRDPHGLLREIDQAELVKQALRMRPDRIIMGEIRGGEAKDLLMAFATGHSGCMGTLHAESARQALLRLEMLVQLGAPQWSLQAVRTLIWLSVQAIVVVGKNDDGSRRLEGLYKIASLEDIGFLLEKIL